MKRAIRLGGTLFALLLVTPTPAWAVEKAAIHQAIDRGVAALKKIQTLDGTWLRQEVGATALAGMTLLECDVPPSDPAVEKAANSVRLHCIELTHTYSLALAIMFLDRLRDPQDTILIQMMAVRLLAGQNSKGGWTYNCPRITGEEEIRRVTNLVKKRIELTGRTELPKPKPADPPNSSPPPPARRDRPPLPEEIAKQLELLNQGDPKAIDPDADNISALGDNSNTQFAMLGLWTARRHNIPVEKALVRLDARFRRSQNKDGGWSYLPVSLRVGGIDDSTATMSCAGLLGLALSHGIAKEAGGRADPKRDFAKDPAIRAGLLALGTCIGNPIGARGKPGVLPPVLTKGYYFLWSVERVAVAFDLKTIGNKDWYNWGAEILLASQGAEGHWQGEYGPDIDTCFALLFLKRANLAGDLTSMLRGKVRDPGEVTLKSGGVGGTALANKGIKTGMDFKDKPAISPATPNPEQQKIDAEIARLAAELVRAPAAQQDKVLEKLRDSKGAVYTQALASAIPKLAEAPRKKAREALADRMTRMTAATLRDKLQDEHVEIRRASALACAMKDDKAHIPDLITALEDPEPLVIRAARAALKSLTGQDFGPNVDATRAERVKAVSDWKTWWNSQARK